MRGIGNVWGRKNMMGSESIREGGEDGDILTQK